VEYIQYFSLKRFVFCLNSLFKEFNKSLQKRFGVFAHKFSAIRSLFIFAIIGFVSRKSLNKVKHS